MPQAVAPAGARAAPKRKPRAPHGRGWRSGASAGAALLRNIGELLELSPAERARALAPLSDKQCDELFYDWSLWARDDQRPPPGDWIYWLILAGRGAGKTRAGAEAVREWVKSFAIVNLIGATHDDVRDVMVLGESGLMRFCPRDERPRYARAAGRLVWPNGAVSLLFSAEEPDAPTRARCAPGSHDRTPRRAAARRPVLQSTARLSAPPSALAEYGSADGCATPRRGPSPSASVSRRARRSGRSRSPRRESPRSASRRSTGRR